MRWPKVTLIAISLIILVIFSSYLFRNSLFLVLANKQLEPFEITADCAQLDFDSSMDVTFEHLCINHALAATELKQLKVQWSWSYSLPWQFKTEIQAVQLDKIALKGNSALPHQPNSAKTALDLQSIHRLFAMASKFEIPTKIDIKAFTYQPFNQHKSYPGAVSAEQNTLTVKLNTPEQTPIITLMLNTDDNKLTGEADLNLFASQHFAQLHDIQLPQPIDLRGWIKSTFNWQNNQLAGEVKINQLDITSEAGIGSSGPFVFKGDLPFKVKLDQSQLQLEMTSNQSLLLDVDEQALQNLAAIYPQLQTLIRDNPSNGFSINPQGQLSVNFDNQSIQYSAVTVENRNDDLPIKVELNQLEADFGFTRLKAAHKTQGIAKISLLTPITKAPVLFSVLGNIEKTPSELKSSWQQHSQIRLAKLGFKERLSAEGLKLNWHGDITLKSNEQPNAQLQLNAELTKVYAPELAKADIVQWQGQLNGNPKAIEATGLFSANAIPLGEFNISGDVRQPELTISAENLSIPDISALILYRPVTLEPLDGLLQYHLSGQLLNLKKPLQNVAELNLGISNLSATVKDTWIQDLYYNQTFTLNNGNITGLPTQENFSLSLVETGSNITDIKMTVGVEQVQQQFSVTLENITGKAFDGIFTMPQFKWPAKADEAATLQLNQIDLEKIVALEKQQGIVVTGKISGELPLYFADKKVTISDGRLYNVGEV